MCEERKKKKFLLKTFLWQKLTEITDEEEREKEREREREREREIALVPWSGGPMASTFECHVTT